MPTRTAARTARSTTADAAEPAGDDQLAARLRVAVTRLNRRLRQESATGVSPSQEAVLTAVKRLGRPTLGELAQTEQVQPPSMTRVIAAMEAGGLLARSGDQDDRRVSRVELTEQGLATLERIRSLKTAYLARQIGLLAPEDRADAERLAHLLERFVGVP